MRTLPFGRITQVFFIGICGCALLACGGSGGGESNSSRAASSIASSVASSSAQPQVAALTASVAGLPEGSQVSVAVNGVNPLMITANGTVTLAQAWDGAEVYRVHIAEQPAAAYCVVQRGIGKATSALVNDIRIECAKGEAAKTAQLFDTDRVHHMRLTLSVDEWNAYTLAIYHSFLQSELYRVGTLEYFDEANQLLATVPNVAFRMRGNTSRTWPETWVNNQPAAPRRFHINLKFDETFEDDESVYACIDNTGKPAAVESENCLTRLASDIASVEDNDGRTFMGVESVALKMNKDDPSYLREALAHTVLRDAGAEAGRAAHVSLELVINASATTTTLYNKPLPQTYNMGVFTLDEAIDKIFVRNRFGKNGYLFKISARNLMQGDAANCVDYDPQLQGFSNANYCTMGVEVIDPATRSDWVGAGNASTASYVNNMRSELNWNGNNAQFIPYRPAFDLKTKKDEIVAARAQLNQLITVINSNPSAAELAAVFDVDSFIRAQAADIVLGAVDHYVRIANNYYLYLNPTTQKWHYLTYDYDFSFRNNHPAQWSSAPLPVFDNVIASTIFTASNGNRWADKNLGQVPQLYHIIFAEQANREQLLAQVGELRRTWLDWEHRTKPLIDVWLDQLAPRIAQLNVDNAFPDTVFNRAAATGDAYPMQLNGSSPNSADTIKNYVQGRHSALAAEAP